MGHLGRFRRGRRRKRRLGCHTRRTRWTATISIVHLDTLRGPMANPGGNSGQWQGTDSASRPSRPTGQQPGTTRASGGAPSSVSNINHNGGGSTTQPSAPGGSAGSTGKGSASQSNSRSTAPSTRVPSFTQIKSPPSSTRTPPTGAPSIEPASTSSVAGNVPIVPSFSSISAISETNTGASQSTTASSPGEFRPSFLFWAGTPLSKLTLSTQLFA